MYVYSYVQYVVLRYWNGHGMDWNGLVGIGSARIEFCIVVVVVVVVVE